MFNRTDPQAVSQQINELGRQANLPDLAGLLRAAGMAKPSDLAENYKPYDLNYKPYDLNYKPYDLAALFGAGGLSLADLPSLAELANAVGALAASKAAVKELRELQVSLPSADRGKLEKGLNYMETYLDVIETSMKRAVAASTASSGASGGGKNVHVHLHLGT